MSLPVRSGVTEAEYLAFERASDEKHEFHAGRIYALAGTSREHGLVALNLGAELRGALRGRPCETFVGDIRVRVSDTGLSTYPDVVVACGEPAWLDAEVDTLLDPTVVVEVLSPSTERYDRGDKFAHYCRLPSLAEYVLVATERPRVERFARQGDVWVLSEADGLDATLALDALGCRIPLAAIYERVTFPDPPPHAPRG